MRSLHKFVIDVSGDRCASRPGSLVRPWRWGTPDNESYLERAPALASRLLIQSATGTPASKVSLQWP